MKEIDSLRSVFMGKESAKRLLAIVEDLMSNVTTGNFARTFRDGDKVFILQLGSNAHSSFFMISELVHGRRKGFIVVPEGKLGSGCRGFGLHLRNAIAPDTLISKQPQYDLKPIVEKSKSLLLVTAEANWKDGGGSKKGKPSNFENTNKSNLHNHSHDTRNLIAEKEKPMSKAKFTHEIKDSVGSGTEPHLSLDVSIRMERGLVGVWKVQWSKVQEVGRNVKPKEQSFKSFDKPSAPFKPKPNRQTDRMANSHRRNNGIKSLKVDGILSSDQGMIADCITQFYTKLYFEEQVDRPFPEALVFPRIFGDYADWLDRPFDEAEILEVI